MSRPLRLVPQAAQPIEFCCPLCGSVHAAYIFGTSQFRIFRCGGCALTFSKKAIRSNDGGFSPLSRAAKNSRSERDHAELLASVDAAPMGGPVLVVGGAQDELMPLLEQRGISVGRIVGPADFGPADWGQRYHAAIVSDSLMQVA